MKTKLLCIVLTCALIFFSFGTLVNAQNQIKAKLANSVMVSRDFQGNSGTVTNTTLLPKEKNSSKSTCDTLNLNAYKSTWTVTSYSVTATPQFSSGFVNGVNTFGDKAKAVYFPNTGANTYVLGGMIALAKAYSTNPAKTVTVKVWNVSGGNPGTMLASQTITMQELMTDVNGSYFTVVHFASPVLVSGAAFFMGIDISGLDWTTSHDTLSIQSNVDPQTSPTATWEMQTDNNWYSYTNASSWGLNISLAIFPVMTNIPAHASFTQSATNACVGTPVTLNASASVQNSVYWVLTGATPSTSSALVPVVAYTNAGTYPVKLYVFGGSCDNLDSMITSITITPSPVPNATATPAAVCPGSSSVLSASNGISYQWNGHPLGSLPDLTVTPTVPTVYTVTVTGSNGCSASQSVSVAINPSPIPNATANPTIFCPGSTVLISATPGMSSYLWTPGGNTTAAFVASPSTNTTYTVSVTDALGCTATDDVAVSLITDVSLGHDTVLCESNSILLDAGAGYDSYLWSNGQTTQTVTITGTGAGTFTYYVVVAKGPCSASDTISITFTTCVGNPESESSVYLNVVPNPTTGITNLIVKGINNPANLVIYSSLGQLMYADKIAGNTTTTIDLSSLAKGVYLVRLFNESSSTLCKLVIQ